MIWVGRVIWLGLWFRERCGGARGDRVRVLVVRYCRNKVLCAKIHDLYENLFAEPISTAPEEPSSRLPQQEIAIAYRAEDPDSTAEEYFDLVRKTSTSDARGR